MTQYMLMFSLGPVQSFIAQARKTRDLWLGSFLLSTLMHSAMQDIQSNLIFPSELGEDGSGLPNKFVAIFDTEQQAIKAATNSTKQISEKWKQLCHSVWEAIMPKNDSRATLTIWNRQTNPANLFEIYWAVVAGDPDNYAQWLATTQKTLNSRKMLRSFLPQDEPGEKSTVSGEREALHGSESSREKVRKFWKSIATEQSPYNINQEGNERLDAIDTVKRFVILDKPFPSTSSIATASFVEKLLATDSNLPGLKEWLKVTGTKVNGKTPLADMPPDTISYLYKRAREDASKRSILKRDGDCYLPETFTEYRLKEDYGLSPEEAIKVAKDGSEALRHLINAAKIIAISRPRSYYAMIQMDGDKMGKLLNGVGGREEHKKISKALSDFARGNTLDIVEERYPGRLIYAGGDDVFALAPLARDYDRQTKPDGFLTVLDLVNELQQQYQKIVKDAVSDKGRQDNVTASTGIAIAHHFTSLSYVRRMAKNAEDSAKHFYGRNALVVTLLRRSGEQTQVGCKWEYPIQEDDEIKTIKPLLLFSDFFDLFKKDVLSSKLVYELLEEAPAIVGTSENPQDQLSIYARQESEIKRVLRRQRNEKKKVELPDKTIGELAHRIANLSRAMDDEKKPDLKKDEKPSTELHSDKRRYGLIEVLGWLLVMDFLAREEHE